MAASRKHDGVKTQKGDHHLMGRLVQVKIPPALRREEEERFIPKSAGAAGAPPPPVEPPDGPGARVAKFIPAETVASYVPLVAAVEAFVGNTDTQFVLALIVFFVGLILTPIYLYRAGKPKNWVQRLNIIIATAAFILWAYMLGGPFEMEKMNAYLWPYNRQVAGIIVGIFSWVAGSIPYEKISPPVPNAQ
jgi:hypothetical protein